jgi:hypothetical protein
MNRSNRPMKRMAPGRGQGGDQAAQGRGSRLATSSVVVGIGLCLN